MTGKITWTKDQEAALRATGDLVLTASAGTGKTTVLVEKFTRELLRLIVDMPSQDLEVSARSPLRRMVAITFTELTAAQLKEKIRLKLSKLYYGSENAEPEEGVQMIQPDRRDYLLRIMRELDGAFISTIHVFCSRLLRENFVEAGLSPAFGIINTEDAARLQDEAARDVLAAAFENDPRIQEIARGRDFASLKTDILRLAASLKTSGLVGADFEEMIAGWREVCLGQAATLAPRLNDSIDSLGRLAKFCSEGGPSANDRGYITDLVAALGKLPKGDFDENDILGGDLCKGLSDAFKVPLTRSNACLALNAGQKRFRTLYSRGKDKEEDESGETCYLEDVLGFDLDIPLMRSLLRAAQAQIELYDGLKRKLDMLDFDDLLLKARNLLRDDTVRERCLRQFTHIFVDEFQDVDPLQAEIVSRLREPGPGRAMVIVGDGKQSIYRFRGADVKTSERFCDNIAGGEGNPGQRLPLQTNFRSRFSLVETFNQIFSKALSADAETNPFQIGPADVESHHKERSAEPLVEWIKLANEAKTNVEAAHVAAAIRRLVTGEERNRQGERFSYGDIAILLRAFTKLRYIEDALRRHSIPYVVVDGKGFYRQREIWDLVSYLKLLWLPEDGFSLATVLRSPLCQLSDETLLRLAIGKKLAFSPLFEGDNIPEEICGDERDRFESLRLALKRHMELRHLLGSAELIEEVLEATSYESVLLADQGGDQASANLRKLIELARGFESEGVDSSLEFALDAAGRLFEPDDESQAGLAVRDGDYVQVLTCHKAKGLEFDVVILPQITYQGVVDFGISTFDIHSCLGVKRFDEESGKFEPTASWNIAKLSLKQQDDAEHLRLLYVAMTRARERLVIVGAEKAKGGRQVKPWGMRLAEILPSAETALEFGVRLIEGGEELPPPIKSEAFVDRHRDAIDALQHIDAAVDGESAALAAEVVSRALEPLVIEPLTFSTSVRELVQLLHQEDDIGDADIGEEREEAGEEADPLEIVRTAPATLGSAVHSYLEAIDYSSPPPRTEIEARLTALGLQPGETALAAGHLERWLSSKEAADINAERAGREVPFTVKLNENGRSLYLTGTIDLLVGNSDGGQWLIDYKYAHAGGNQLFYETQLLLYALACREAFGKAPQRLSLVYLKEADQVVDVRCDDGALDDLHRRVFECLAQPCDTTGVDIPSKP